MDVDRTRYFGEHVWNFTEMLEEINGEAPGEDALPSPDGVALNAYLAVPEYKKEETKQLEGIAFATLAFAVYSGLPNFYDTTSNTEGEWYGYEPC